MQLHEKAFILGGAFLPIFPPFALSDFHSKVEKIVSKGFMTNRKILIKLYKNRQDPSIQFLSFHFRNHSGRTEKVKYSSNWYTRDQEFLMQLPWLKRGGSRP